jgi:EmrB/QacA subfamily drug resistance transporter
MPGRLRGRLWYNAPVALLAREPQLSDKVDLPPAAGRPEANPAPVALTRPWLTLAVVLTGTFIVFLDIGIVNVAIPTIQRNLNASDAQIQFVVASYQLAYAVFLITGGRLGDLFGRKRMFLVGLGGFVAASLLCGLATGPLALIVARALQGLTAAVLYPQIASIIQVTFPPERRGGAFGMLGATIGLGTITGPLLGGLLVAADIAGTSWRPIFLVNVPIGGLALVAAALLLPESRGAGGRRLDLVGVALVSLGILLLTVPVVEGREAGWPWWAWLCMAASAPVLLGFVAYERRLIARGGAPLLDLRLFEERAFSVGLLLTGVYFLGVVSFFLFFALYLQRGLGYEPLRSALTIVPWQTASFFFSLVSARVTRRLGRGVLSLSTALLVVGLSLVIVILGLRGAGLRGPELIPAMAICGAGFGLFIGPSLTIILAGVQPRNAGAAAGVLATVGQIAGAFGVALVGVILFGLLGTSLEEATPEAFTRAIRLTLIVHVLIYAASFALVQLLPKLPTPGR